MEQITRRDGIYYYGDERCVDIDDAYMRFRSDYHRSIGRKAFSRLDRLGQRKERVHGFGLVFSGPDIRYEYPRRECVLLGMAHLSYCWLADISDLVDTDRWIDWAFSKGSKALVFKGRRDKVGRTSKRKKRRYR